MGNTLEADQLSHRLDGRTHIANHRSQRSPKRLQNTKTQAEQNLSKKEKPKMDSDDPPEPVTEKDK
jgi:hypothetical protein